MKMIYKGLFLVLFIIILTWLIGSFFSGCNYYLQLSELPGKEYRCTCIGKTYTLGPRKIEGGGWDHCFGIKTEQHEVWADIPNR